MTARVRIAPSLPSADFARLGEEVIAVIAAAALRRRIDANGREIWLEVDGRVNEQTVQRVVAAGANTLVAGSAIFSGGNYARAIAALRSGAEEAPR